MRVMPPLLPFVELPSIECLDVVGRCATFVGVEARVVPRGRGEARIDRRRDRGSTARLVGRPLEVVRFVQLDHFELMAASKDSLLHGRVVRESSAVCRSRDERRDGVAGRRLPTAGNMGQHIHDMLAVNIEDIPVNLVRPLAHVPLQLSYQGVLLALLEYLLATAVQVRLGLRVREADVVHGQLGVAASTAVQNLLLLLDVVDDA